MVEVGCIAELCFLTSGGGPGRTAVAGSERVEGDFSFYRPVLTMRVVGFSVSRDEYGAAVSWQMQLEEA
jgi:hypothetical protein